MQTNPAILFLTFARPEETAVVFEAIRKYKPQRLYWAADGPRSHRAGEAERCQLVRDISKRIDWDCELKTLFRTENLGCKNAVSSAITWFFEHEEEGIIIEDDCLPSEDFFRLCQWLLPAFRTNEKVMHIGGNNFQDGKVHGEGSYYYSAIPHIWGWATWRRAWKHYDIGMNDFDRVKKESELPLMQKSYWFNTFDRVRKGEIDTWDYQWTFSIWKHKGECITPQVNLVTNIGFGSAGTHTVSSNDELSKLDFGNLGTLIHPHETSINKTADSYWYKKIIPWQLKLKSLVKYLRRK